MTPGRVEASIPAWVPNRLEIRPRPTEEAFAASRTAGIGGTDIAAILGLSTRRSAFDVAVTKKGLAGPPAPAGEEAEWGIVFERPVVERIAKLSGEILTAPPVTFRDTTRPWATANPDYLYVNRAVGGDVKTRSPWVRDAWGPDGSDEVPPDELFQAHWYNTLLDAESWELAVLFDRRMSTFHVERDRELSEMILDAAGAFWRDYVLTDALPPRTGALVDPWLRKRFPKETEPIRPASEAEELLAQAFEAARADTTRAEAEEQRLALAIKEAIGEAAGVEAVDGTWRITWKRNKDTVSTDWAAVARTAIERVQLAASLNPPVLLDPSMFLKELGGLVHKHTARTPGPRVLRPSFNLGTSKRRRT